MNVPVSRIPTDVTISLILRNFPTRWIVVRMPLRWQVTCMDSAIQVSLIFVETRAGLPRLDSGKTWDSSSMGWNAREIYR
jgi:hypothetical protein